MHEMGASCFIDSFVDWIGPKYQRLGIGGAWKGRYGRRDGRFLRKALAVMWYLMP